MKHTFQRPKCSDHYSIVTSLGIEVRDNSFDLRETILFEGGLLFVWYIKHIKQLESIH
jgi:hypothetical protein